MPESISNMGRFNGKKGITKSLNELGRFFGSNGFNKRFDFTEVKFNRIKVRRISMEIMNRAIITIDLRQKS